MTSFVDTERAGRPAALGEFQEDPNMFRDEASWARFIPGYSASRCMKLRGRAMNNAILLLAGVAILFFGYDSSCMSQINTNTNYLKLMGLDNGTDRDSAAIGGLVSFFFVGFGIGAILVGYFADRVGRVRTIVLGCLWALFGGALQACAQNYSWMALSRTIGGIGCGHLNTIVPVWTSELAQAKSRGAFVGVEFTLALVGGTIVYWTEFGCLHTRSLEFSWRFPLALQEVFLLMILFAVPFYPESPRYLAKTKRVDEAREILRKCRVNTSEAAIDEELSEIMGAIRLEASEASPSFWHILTKPDKLKTRRRIMLGAGIQIMQKFTGIDFISNYAPEMFSLAGYGGDKPSLLAGGNFFGYIASLALSVWLADKLGRRWNMLIGCALLFVVLIVGGVCSHEVIKYHSVDPFKASQFGAVTTTCLYLFTFIYGATWLTTCWVYPTEVFPLASRAKGTAISTVAFSIAGVIINEIVPYLIKAISFWTLILFALVNLVMLIPIYLFYVETAGRHLEDLDVLFANDSPFYWNAERDFKEFKEAESAADRTLMQEKMQVEERERKA